MGAFADLKNLKWGDWFYTLVAAGISAAATAVMANPIASMAGAAQFTPRQLMIFAGSSALVAIAGVLKKSPLPDRTVAIALLPGVHTPEDVKQIEQATEPGSVPTPEVAAAILGKKPQS